MSYIIPFVSHRFRPRPRAERLSRLMGRVGRAVMGDGSSTADEFVPALGAGDQVAPDLVPAVRLREATDDDERLWDAFLRGQPAADFLQTWAWGAVATFDGEPVHRFVLEDRGQVAGVVAVQERTSRGLRTWYAPHGPVLDATHPRAATRLRALVDGLRAAGRHAGVMAVRLEPRLDREEAATSRFGELGLRHIATTVQVGRTQLLDIGGSEADVLLRVDGPTRRKIRRAARDGITTAVTTDPAATDAVHRLQQIVRETELRSGAAGRGLERIGVAWRAFASRGSAAIVEAWDGDRLMAAGMVVVTGERSVYLFSGSRREAPGTPKRFPSYAMQWEMIRVARHMGAITHDLWGIEPAGAGPEHPWAGIGAFKRSFGGRSVAWSGGWDLVLRPSLYHLREATAEVRSRLLHPVRAARPATRAA